MFSNDTFYSVLFAHHPQPLWIFDAQTLAFLDVNQAAIDAYGYTREAFLHMTLADIRPLQDRAHMWQHIRQLQRFSHQSGPWRHQRQDGSLLEVKIKAHQLEFRERPAVLVVIQDVTQEQAALRAESASQTRWEYAQENTGVGLWEWDLRQDQFQFSPQLVKMLGQDPQTDALRPQNWRAHIHPEDVSLIEKPLLRCLLGKSDQFEAAHRVRDADGVFRWMQTRGKVLERLPDGRPALILGAMVDIQPVKTLMTHLEHERQRLLLAQSAAGLGVWEFDLSTRLIHWDPQMYALYGETPETFAFTMEERRARVHPDDYFEFGEADLQELLAGPRVWHYRVFWPDGSLHHLETHGRLLLDAEGKPARLIGVCSDITARKQAEAVLLENQLLLQQLTQNTPGVFFQIEQLPDGIHRMRYVSDTVREWLELDPETLAAQPERLAARVHPDDRARMRQEYAEALRQEQVWVTEFRTALPSGRQGWMMGSVRPIPEPGGQICWYGYLVDISARKVLEQALTLKEARLQLAQSTSGVGVWDRDLLTGEVTWDARLYAMMEIDPQVADVDMLGYARIYPDDQELLVDFRARMFAQDEVASVVVRVSLPEKGLRYHQVFGRVLRDESGRAVRLMGTTQDVTDHKLAEKHLESIGEALWESNRRLEHALGETRELAIKVQLAYESKREFLNNMSHELRTPLHGVIGMSELLAQNGLNPDQLRMCEIIRHSGQSLLTLVNAVLDYSRLDHRDFVLRPEPFDLSFLLGQIAEEMAVLAYDKGLELAVEWRPGLALHYRGDALRLRQMLYHFLHNALKFTERGEVRLVVSPLPESADETSTQTLRFEVWDTGIGLEPRLKTGIFDLFAQGNSSTTRRYGGTGIGLALVKRLVEHMRGRLGVESPPQGGSCFWFEITLPADLPGPEAPPPLSGRPVLLVSETALALHPLRPLLAHWGCQIRHFQSMSEACLGVLPGEILLRDWPLTERDPGLQSCQHTPSLLLAYPEQFTAYQLAYPDSQPRWVPKPARPPELLQALLDLSSTPVSPEPSLSIPVGPARILVVEDNPINQLLAETVLLKLGYAVTTAAHGGLALEALTAEPFDLILMDCQMPEMDGYTATRLIRQGEGGQGHVRIPIVALTAHGQEEDRDKCLLAGMDDYMLKPFTSSQLDAMILRWLPAYRRASV